MGGQMQSGDREQIEERQRVEREEVRAGRAKPWPRCGARVSEPCIRVDGSRSKPQRERR